MTDLKVDEIIEATGGKLLSENSKTFKGVSIDSRTISDGQVFFAIRGDRFNGHDFLGNALLKGGGAVVDTRPEPLPKGKVIIYVNDTLRSLQELAHFLRIRRDIPVVAITGSNGKTTTKEMVNTFLSGKFRTLKNEGNLNNHIGLPLSLTGLGPDDEAVVLEMGMNASGEIRRLCEIALPSHGVITNVGMAHVGKLGGYDAVRDAKLEIVKGLSVAVVNADDAGLIQGVSRIKDFKGKIITFAVNNDAHFRAKNIRDTENGSDFILECGDKGSAEVSLNVHGLFNVYNALASAAVSFSVGMTVDEIKIGLETFRAFPMRFEVIRGNGITVINDCYNANPTSMKESIKELLRIGAKGRVVAVLGDMRELHDFSETEHRSLGRMVCEMGIDVFVAVGEMMGLAAEERAALKGEKCVTGAFTFKDIEAAKKDIGKIIRRGDTILVKGSRAMSMEKIIGSMTDVV